MRKEIVIRPPVNIWNNIERCWVLRLDIVFEGQTITGIHNSEFVDVIHDIDQLCEKLQQYKSEMQVIYNGGTPQKRSMLATYIYILFDSKAGCYKIGRSIKPEFRERTLMSERSTFKMIWVSPLTNLRVEKEIHNHFASKRIRGEWFNLDASDIETIKNSFNYGT